MSSERYASLFRNGRNQALRIPKEFELDGEKAIIRKEDDKLIIEPVKKDSLLKLLASLDQIDDEFPDVDEELPPLDDTQL